MSDLKFETSREEDWKREFGYVLFTRRRVMLSVAAVVLLGAILITLFWPKSYASSSSLLVLGKRAKLSPAALDPVEFRNPEVSAQDIISELEIIRSPELARRVVHWLVKPLRDKTKTEERSAEEVQEFLRNLDAVSVPDSSAIQLRFYARSPKAAEDGLEALLNEYVQYRAEVFNPAGQDQFFEERIVHYQTQLKDLVDRINAEGGELSPVFIDKVIEGNLGRLALLQQRLSDLEMELASSTFVENEPIKKRIEVVKEAISQLQQETNEIQATRMAADSTFRQAQLISHSLETFAKRAEEARINDSIARSRLTGDVSILSRAAGSAELVFPRAKATILLGLIVAVITGLSVGFFAEFFDHTVRRPEDVQRNTGLAVLCSFPLIRENEGSDAPDV